MEYIRADQVLPGDLLDLEGDRYADTLAPDGEPEYSSLRYQYAEVCGVEVETSQCVRLDIEGVDSFGFPVHHLVKLHARDND